MGPDSRVLVRKSRKQAEHYNLLYKVSQRYIQVVPSCLNMGCLKVRHFLPKSIGRLPNRHLIPVFMLHLPKTPTVISKSFRFSNRRMETCCCSTPMDDALNSKVQMLIQTVEVMQEKHETQQREIEDMKKREERSKKI